jgi:hypothetical protein
MDEADVSTPGWWARLRRLFGRPPQSAPWLDLTQGELDGACNKQALRAVLERRRRNDLIRQRELDELRQARHRGLDQARPQAHVSIFQDAESAVVGGRELTLRKIDDIEAQMSRQWWDKMPPPPDVPAPGDEHAWSDQEFAPTQFGGVVMRAELALSEAGAPGAPAPLRAHDGGAAPAAPALDPALAEAALRWAVGDGAQAESVLLAALRDGAPGARAPRLAALLDLYRATAQRAAFDRALAEFAADLPVVPAWQPALPTQPGEFELDAALTGDMEALLRRLADACDDTQLLPLSCARLQRLDFTAAGALLSWLPGARCALELRELSPLVAAFLEILGVGAQARLLPRRV